MFEHRSEYAGPKGTEMAILDIPVDTRLTAGAVTGVRAAHVRRQAQGTGRTTPPARAGASVQHPTGRPVRRPHPGRPAGAALRHRGTGVLMSRASHRRRPITPVTTVLLALVAAGITVWLGLV